MFYPPALSARSFALQRAGTPKIYVRFSSRFHLEQFLKSGYGGTGRIRRKIICCRNPKLEEFPWTTTRKSSQPPPLGGTGFQSCGRIRRVVVGMKKLCRLLLIRGNKMYLLAELKRSGLRVSRSTTPGDLGPWKKGSPLRSPGVVASIRLSLDTSNASFCDLLWFCFICFLHWVHRPGWWATLELKFNFLIICSVSFSFCFSTCGGGARQWERVRKTFVWARGTHSNVQGGCRIGWELFYDTFFASDFLVEAEKE